MPPPLRGLFDWLDVNLPGSCLLRESDYGFAIFLTTHVLGMCLFLGLIIMMDLRLAGLAHKRTPVSEIQRRLFPWQMLGMTISTITGTLLFWAQPLRYWGKWYFWIKMILMGLAGVNAMVFHFTTYRSVATWDRDAVPPFGARMAGYMSLALWAGVLASGRLVAYEWLTTEPGGLDICVGG